MVSELNYFKNKIGNSRPRVQVDNSPGVYISTLNAMLTHPQDIHLPFNLAPKSTLLLRQHLPINLSFELIWWRTSVTGLGINCSVSRIHTSLLYYLIKIRKTSSSAAKTVITLVRI